MGFIVCMTLTCFSLGHGALQPQGDQLPSSIVWLLRQLPGEDHVEVRLWQQMQLAKACCSFDEEGRKERGGEGVGGEGGGRRAGEKRKKSQVRGDCAHLGKAPLPGAPCHVCVTGSG